MRHFFSLASAYAWSYEVLSLWRCGSAFDPDPDLCTGRGATGGMGTVLSALSIMVIADRYDPGIRGQSPPIDRSRSWFEKEFLPRDDPHAWRRWEEHILDKAKCEFCYDLWFRGIFLEEGCPVYGEARKRCGQR